MCRRLHHLADPGLLGQHANGTPQAEAPGHLGSQLEVGTQRPLPRRLDERLFVTLQRVMQRPLASLFCDQLRVQRREHTGTSSKPCRLDSQLGQQLTLRYTRRLLLQSPHAHLSQLAKKETLRTAIHSGETAKRCPDLNEVPRHVQGQFRRLVEPVQVTMPFSLSKELAQQAGPVLCKDPIVHILGRECRLHQAVPSMTT